MSKTVRKIDETREYLLNTDLVNTGYGYTYHIVRVTPTKKELAIAYSDSGAGHGGYSYRSHQWYFNRVSRKRRRSARDLRQKLYTSEDYEDFDYFESGPEKYRKGIWSDIY